MNAEQAQNIRNLIEIIKENDLIRCNYINEANNKCCVVGHGMKLAGINIIEEIQKEGFMNGASIDVLPVRYINALNGTFGLSFYDWGKLQSINDSHYEYENENDYENENEIKAIHASDTKEKLIAYLESNLQD